MQPERCAGRPSQCPGRTVAKRRSNVADLNPAAAFLPVNECEPDRWVTLTAHERRLGEQVGDPLPDHSRVAFVPPRVAGA
jgi:hypothetical protein